MGQQATEAGNFLFGICFYFVGGDLAEKQRLCDHVVHVRVLFDAQLEVK